MSAASAVLAPLRMGAAVGGRGGVYAHDFMYDIAGLRATLDKIASKEKDDRSLPLPHNIIDVLLSHVSQMAKTSKTSIQCMRMACEVVGRLGLSLQYLERWLPGNLLTQLLQHMITLPESTRTLANVQHCRYIVRTYDENKGDVDVKKMVSSLENFLAQKKDEKESENQLLYPYGECLVPVPNVVAQIAYDLALWYFKKKEYTIANKYFTVAKEFQSQKRPEILNINKNTYVPASFIHFNLDSLNGFQRACGSTSASVSDGGIIAALLSLRGGDSTALFAILDSPITFAEAESSGTLSLDPEIAWAETRNDVLPEDLSWKITVRYTIVCAATRGTLPPPLFWTELSLHVCNPELMEYFFANCNEALMYFDNNSRVCDRVQKLAAYAINTMQIKDQSLATILREKFSSILPTITLESKGEHDKLRGSYAEGMRASIDLENLTDKERELEIVRTVDPTVVKQLAQYPEAANVSPVEVITSDKSENISQFEKHVILKCRRLRQADPLDSHKSMKFIEALGHTSAEASEAITHEKLMLLSAAILQGTATPADHAEIEQALPTLRVSDAVVFDSMSAYILNKGDWKGAFAQAKKWIAHASGRSRQLCVLLQYLALACTAVEGKENNSTAQTAENVSTQGEIVFSTQGNVAPLCQCLVSLLEDNNKVNQSLKRKRDSQENNVDVGGSGWDNMLGFIAALKHPIVIRTLVSGLTIAYNRSQTSGTNRISVSRYGKSASLFVPIAASLVISDMEDIKFREALLYAVQMALTHMPRDDTFKLALADLFHVKGDHLMAVRSYLEAFGLACFDFQQPVPQKVLGKKILHRMAVSLIEIKAFVQAAALCQYLRPVDHSLAFKALNQACGGPYPAASEVYFQFIWDLSMLELLAQLHKKGDARKLNLIRILIGRQEFNESTDRGTRNKAIETNRHDLLHALAREFMSNLRTTWREP
eukprot:m.10378 g.10378  ORF g.10378 m.10378 type:complete len:943 (+) comp4251_c0_seq2:290-3118(+)